MINKVTLIGHAGNDPEFRTLDTGTAVARVSLATNESYKDKEGNWQNVTEWHNLILWRELAERARDIVKKGSTLYVEGKIQSRKYTDSAGVEKSITDIVVNSFRVLDKRERNEDNRIPTNEALPRNSNDAGKAYQEAEAVAHGAGNNNGMEPLPF